MRMFLSAALATVIFASSALAEDAANPLTPGKPAGVKEAQNGEVNPIVYVGLGLVAAAILIAASHSSHHNGSSTTTTTTTGTSP
jgi:N-acetylneuraminic acid mutarotase